MQKDPEQLLKDLKFLLADLCTDWGFCNRLTAGELLRAGSTLTDVEFAHAVLQAEKMNPEYEPKWVKQIRERFTARFGTSISRAA